MLKRLDATDPNAIERIERIVCRGEGESAAEAAVREILDRVRSEGDAAVCEFTERFDRIRLRPERLRIEAAEFDDAETQVDVKFAATLERMRDRIASFHANQRRTTWMEEQPDGSCMGQLVRPLERVGIYVPGGEAPYPSTVVMCAVPAGLAGVRECVIATPPQRDGRVHPAVLVAARLCGVDSVYRIGGAQAIAAMAYGTATVPAVDKIVGPGNVYVEAAKRRVFGTVDIDTPAGPSEVVVLADGTANPDWVAADLLSQAEHDRTAMAILVTPCPELAEAVDGSLERQIDTHPRSDVMREALDRYGAAVITRSLDEAIALVNRLAPEHLEVLIESPYEALGAIRNAGMMLVGPFAPVALCDYGAGPNHVLPTGGSARFASPLGVEDFVKRSNLLIASHALLDGLASDVCRVAEIEGFTAHAASVRRRRGSEDG